MKTKERLFNSPLNIQLFAGANGYEYGNVELSQGEQAKYNNSIKKALGAATKMPLQGWFQESASKKEAYSLFYLSGRLKARNIDDTIKTVAPDYIPKDVKGQDITDFLKAIRVYPTGMECPVYIKKRDFDRSQLGENSAIVDAQVSAIYAECSYRIANLFKDCAVNLKRSVHDSVGKSFDLTIPTVNVFGDSTQLFDTPANIKAFRLMMLKAQEAAEAQNLKIGIIAGVEGRAELANAEKFSNKDYGEGETRKTGQPLKYICGGEVLPLWGFDNTFYPNGEGDIGYFVVIVEKVFGQDNKDVAVSPESNYIPDKKAYLLDVEVYNSTELLDPEGVFIFKYKRDKGTAGASTLSMRNVTPQAAPQNSQPAPNIEDVIKLEEAKLKRAEAEKAAYEAKLKVIEAEKTEKEETTSSDVKKDVKKTKEEKPKNPENGTTE